MNLFLAVWQYQANINVSDKVNLIYCGQENKEIGTHKVNVYCKLNIWTRWQTKRNWKSKAHTIRYEWNTCSKSSYSTKHSKPDTINLINLSMCSTYANCVQTAYKNYKLLLRNDLDKYDVCVFIGLWKWNIVNCRLNGIWRVEWCKLTSFLNSLVS